MVLQRYQITWCPYSGGTYYVSMMLEPEMVDTATSEKCGVKETPVRLEFLTRVRDTAAITHPALRMEQIHLQHLAITQPS